MAIRSFNSVGGFSVAETPVEIVSNVGNVTPTNLDVSGGLSDLGAVGNVTITGGSANQALITDGFGGLSGADGACAVSVSDAGWLSGRGLALDGNLALALALCGGSGPE